MKNLQLSQIQSIEEKLRSKLIPQPSGCWEWSAGTHPQGYGLVGIGKKKFYVHRLMMCLKLGRVITGKEHVCHKCDNPPCANPEHLFLGDAKKNIKDRDRKGRGRWAVGSRSGQSKLTEADVIKLREMYATGEYSFIDLASIHDMTTYAIHAAVVGRTWKHVGGPIDECKRLAKSKDRLKNIR